MEKIWGISLGLCLLIFAPLAAGEIRREPVAFIKVDNSGFLVEGQVVDEETGEGIEGAVVEVRVAGKSWKVGTETKIIPAGYWGKWERLDYSLRTVGREEYEGWSAGWVQHSENSASEYGKCIVRKEGRDSYWISEISYGRKWIDNSKRDGGYFRVAIWGRYELELSAKGYEPKIIRGDVRFGWENLGKVGLKYRPFELKLSRDSESLTRGWNSRTTYLGSSIEDWTFDNWKHLPEKDFTPTDPLARAKLEGYEKDPAYRVDPIWEADVYHYEKIGERTVWIADVERYETIYGFSSWSFSKRWYWNGSYYQAGVAYVQKSIYDDWRVREEMRGDLVKISYGKGYSCDVLKTKVTYNVYHNNWGKWEYIETKTEWVDGNKAVGDVWYGGWFSDWKNVVTEVHDYQYGNYRYYCYYDVYMRSWVEEGKGWVSKGRQTFESKPSDTSEYRYKNVSSTMEPVYGWVSKGTQEIVGKPQSTGEWDYRNKQLVRYEVYGRIEKCTITHSYLVSHSPEAWDSVNLIVTLENRNGYDNVGYLKVVPKDGASGITPSFSHRRAELPFSSVLSLQPGFSMGSGSYVIEVQAYDAKMRLAAVKTFTLNLASSQPGSSIDTRTEVSYRHGWENWVALTIVVAEGKGSTTPEAGVHLYKAGTCVELRATPAEDYVFSQWELDNGDTIYQQQFELTLDRDRKVLVYFFEQPKISQGIEGGPVYDGGLSGGPITQFYTFDPHTKEYVYSYIRFTVNGVTCELSRKPKPLFRHH